MKIDFEMRLHDSPFKRVELGKKTIEVRLLDEKRRLLKVGNVIRFRRRFNSTDFVDVQVVDLLKYNSFKDLFLNYGAKFYGLSINYSCEEFIKGCRKFYSIKKEREFGVLGIKFKLIKDEDCRVTESNDD